MKSANFRIPEHYNEKRKRWKKGGEVRGNKDGRRRLCGKKGEGGRGGKENGGRGTEPVEKGAKKKEWARTGKRRGGDLNSISVVKRKKREKNHETEGICTLGQV